MNEAVLEVKEVHLIKSKTLYFIIKRVFDFSLALLFFIMLLPISLFIYIAIKLEDRGPLFYVQKRTGKNGKVFNMYKFRSMSVLTERNGKKLTHDERVTKIGRIIRKTSLDELPQILNILKGEMSFIGPRPWMTIYYDNFNEKQKKRVSVLPGITGLAQASGRNGLTIFEKINYDIKYVEKASILFDLKIVFMTIKTVLKKESVDLIQESIEDEINDLKNQERGE